MKTFINILLFSFFLCNSAFTAEVKVFFTNSMPPYLFESNEEGLEFELIEAALKSKGHTLKVVDNVSYKRGLLQLSSSKIDGVVGNKNNSAYKKKSKNVYPSNVVLKYVDCAITLKKNHIRLNNISDYKDKRVWAFKTAKKVLGEEFSKMANENPKYSEEFLQRLQVKVLIKNRIDVAISDKNIFLYQLNLNKKLNYSKNDFDFKSISPQAPRAIMFRNKKLRYIFNKGLKEIRKNGTYNKILTKYKKYSHERC